MIELRVIREGLASRGRRRIFLYTGEDYARAEAARLRSALLDRRPLAERHTVRVYKREIRVAGAICPIWLVVLTTWAPQP